MNLFLKILSVFFGVVCLVFFVFLAHYQYSQPELTATQLTIKYWPFQLGLMVSFVVARLLYSISKRK